MRPNNKKILVTRELHEMVIIRSERRFQLFCGICLAESNFVTLDEAVGLSGIGTRKILRRVETGEIHACEAPNGQIASMRKFIRQLVAEGTQEV